MRNRKKTSLTEKYIARMHQGAKSSTHQNALELRHRQTQAEAKLWSLLRNRQLNGKKFRRQHAIAGYVVDFYCHESKIAVEVDGSGHLDEQSREYDKSRTESLHEIGIDVIRFWNEEVLKDSTTVLQKISKFLH